MNEHANPSASQPARSPPDDFYRLLFEESAASVFVLDFTRVVPLFARLRAGGVLDFVAHLALHPELTGECRRLVRMVEATARAVASAGMPSKDELRARFAEITVPPLPESLRYVLEALWAGRHQIEEEYRYLDASGEHRTCVMRCHVPRVASGPDLSRVTLMLLDLTTGKRSASAHLENQGLLQQILARANILLWWAKVSREGDSFHWKVNVPQQSLDSPLLGLATAVDKGGLWDHHHTPDFDAMADQAVAALRGGQPGYQHEFRIVKDGVTRWLHEEVGIRPLGEDEWSLVGVISDVTKSHEAEEASRRSAAQLRHLVERAACMLWQARVTDTPEGLRWKFEVPYSGLRRRTGAADDRLTFDLGATPQRLLEAPYQVPDQGEMDARSALALRTGAPGYEQEFRIISDGATHWLHESVSITPAGPGQWDLVGVTVDITARQEAEEARRATEAQLQQILQRVDCILWQAEVVEGEGRFNWSFNVTDSGLLRRIGAAEQRESDPLRPGARRSLHGRWNSPEGHEMDARSSHAFHTGAPGYEQEFRAITPGGTFWLHEQVSIHAADPGRWQLVGVIVDVTARRQAEEAHRATEAQLQQILQRADCLIWEGRVTENSSGQFEWQIYFPESVLHWKLFTSGGGDAPGSLWHAHRVPDLAEMNARSTRAIRENQPGYEQEFRFHSRDGSTIWMHEQVSIKRIEPGIWNLVGVVTDISARRQAEAELAAEKERLAVTLRAMTEGVITTDTNGTVQFINQAALALTGHSAEQAVGLSIGTICPLEDERTRERFELPVALVLDEGALVDLPPHSLLRDTHHETRLVAGCCAPVRDAASRIVGAVFVFRDITERQRLEEEIQRASKLQSIGVLAGGIAHDFNNILTAIMGNLSLGLLDVGENAELERCLREAQQATVRARDLTQQLLTFAKGGEPVRAAVNLAQVVSEVTQFTLHGSRVRSEFDVPPNLWSADADKGQVGQIVQNLVLNSVQAMPAGGTIRISACNDTPAAGPHRALAPGDYIRLTIADTGTGIPAEHIEHIFEPYFTTKQQGSGLGLATVYSIVRKHRGHIEVESVMGRGTTFSIWLPALRQKASVGPSAPRSLTTQRLHGRALFLDDEPPIQKVGAALLKRLGLEVTVVADGREAVQVFREAKAAGKRYEVVIMDLTVPGGMGGREALEEMRHIDPHVRAIVSSGYSSDPVLANHRAHGFRGMVAKPYQADEFTRVVRDVIAGHDASSESSQHAR